MTFTSMRLVVSYALIFALCIGIVACGGGGDDNDINGPIIGEDFSLMVMADPDTGPAPLTVTLFVTPSGGSAPYSYAWDFDGDGVTDSNMASGTHIYTQSGVAVVTVTDAANRVVTASKTITITQDGGGGVTPGTGELDVRFNASPQVGNVPFEVQFEAFASGGKEPYSYSWDFDGDGTFDSFLKNPLYIFEQTGQQTDTDTYVFYPVLQVEDNRGVIATNLDDADGNGNPDFRMAINALPPSELNITAIANPLVGQAPLRVEFTGAATGGSGEYEYSWNFGDGNSTSGSASSIVNHTYVANGIYLATCTVNDTVTGQSKTSSPLRIQATVGQNFSIDISGDITNGQVPFLSNFEVTARNGQEPIQYQWDIFDDEPLDPEPSLTTPPSLDRNAVVTPSFTSRKNPTFHFANTARENGAKQYLVRCVAVDSQGNTAVSNMVRVTANGTFPPDGNPYYYEAEKPDVVGFSYWDPTGTTSHPLFNATSGSWTPRANPAICSHPTGLTYIIGGEILDENGNLDDMVDRGDSVYMYVPRASANGTGETSIGKFDVAGNSIGGTPIPNLAGNLVRLNDDFGPAFPGQGDRTPPPQPTQRTSSFTIVGSAAAIFMHEIPESNPYGNYEAARNNPMTPIPPYPDDPTTGWGNDAPPFNMNGLGAPVIFVFGGRTSDQGVVAMTQKYYPYGYGTEDLWYDSLEDEFQTTCNQTNIWSNYFLRPDTDQYPGADADPEIDDRIPGQAGDTDQAGPLPDLPEPTYGLMAVGIETGVHSPSPQFPNGGFRSAYIFGGINENGQVLSSCYIWQLDTPPGADNDESVWQPLANMPTPRAYGKAIFLPYTFQVALVGGHDQNGVALDTIDIFSFADQFNPGTGAWTTFEGTLPEALEACGAGYNDRAETSESYVLTFGGWNEESFTNAIYNARLRSASDVVLKAPVPVVPRRNMGSTQSGARLLPTSFNRYYLVAGVDENGSNSIIEVVTLP